MRKAKKTLLAAACACALVVGTVAGTVAYLTATAGPVTNTFTVGNVSFDEGLNGGLDEAKVNEYGELVYKTDPETGEPTTTLADRVKANTYKLVPGHEYVKDPTVYLDADSEAAWLFVKVDNGISDIEADDGTITTQMTTRGWTLVDSTNGIYRYGSTPVKANTTGYVVFEYFKLASDADVADYEDASIVVNACAVQGDGVDADTALSEAKDLLVS